MGAGDLAFTMGLSGRYVDEIPGKLKERIGETARQIADGWYQRQRLHA